MQTLELQQKTLGRTVQILAGNKTICQQLNTQIEEMGDLSKLISVFNDEILQRMEALRFGVANLENQMNRMSISESIFLQRPNAFTNSAISGYSLENTGMDVALEAL